MRNMSIPKAAVLVLAISISGCITNIPKSLPDRADDMGGMAVAVDHFGPLTVVRNASILPGKIPYKKRKADLVETCESPSIQMTLAVDAGARIETSPEQLTRMCNQLLEAAYLGAHWQGLEPLPSRLRFIIAPPDARGIVQHRDFALFSKPRMTLIAPSLATPDETLNNVIDAAAHESFHFFAYLARREQSVIANEDIAYLIGNCAVFKITGALAKNKRSIQINPSGLPENVRQSNAANISSRVRLASLFGEADVIHRDTPQGEALQATCDQIPAMLEHTTTQPPNTP